MVRVFRLPGPALAPFVAVLWHVDEPLPPGLERKIPTGSMQLVVNLRQDRLRWFDGQAFGREHRTAGSGLCGPIDHAVGIHTGDQRTAVGAEFRPGGTTLLCTTPAHALGGAPVIDLATIWGRDGATLRERLLDQPSPHDRISVLEDVLVTRLRRFPGPDETVRGGHRREALSGPWISEATRALEDGHAVRDVGDRLGMTTSTFTRRFRSAVGLNPKPFARLRRLQRVLTSLPGDRPDWSGVAAAHRFADQAHLIHEFRSITGVTPTAYVPRSPGESNHVPLRPD